MAPMIWALSGGGARLAGVFSAALILAVTLSQTGIVGSSRLTPASTIVVAPGRADEQCEQIRALMREARIALDTSDPQQPRIIGQYADQIPENIRGVVIACLASAPLAPQDTRTR